MRNSGLQKNFRETVGKKKKPEFMGARISFMKHY